MGRFGRYVGTAPLVAEKILAIAALLATYTLPKGQLPVQEMARFVSENTYAPVESRNRLNYESFSPQDMQIILIFAAYLVELVPKAHLSNVERYIHVCAANSVCKSYNHCDKLQMIWWT
jgi:hypothetical protein